MFFHTTHNTHIQCSVHTYSVRIQCTHTVYTVYLYLEKAARSFTGDRSHSLRFFILARRISLLSSSSPPPSHPHPHDPHDPHDPACPARSCSSYCPCRCSYPPSSPSSSAAPLETILKRDCSPTRPRPRPRPRCLHCSGPG